MTALGVAMVVLMFLFFGVVLVVILSRIGSIEKRLDKYGEMLSSQLEINNNLQAQIMALNEATNQRIAAIMEKINVDGWQD